MATLVYVLCALTSLACAVLLLRGYRRSGVRLLLWSGLCFVGLTLSNVVLIVDAVLLPGAVLFDLRLCIAAAAMTLLLYGLIWDSD